jgi:hypothetical protein
VTATTERYNHYLRRRIEERPGPRLTASFPATRDEWLAFAREARRTLRDVFDFPADDCPLNARIVGRQECGDYVIERLLYEVEPGSTVPAHLYVPKEARYPSPALILGSGHGGSKSKYYNQYAGQLYARAGLLCLIPDPPGEEERDEQCRMGVRGHRLAFRVDRGLAIRRQEIGKFVYDLKRGLDYLCARPEVDPTRIGCAGHSLGGTLTMYLSALDERIRLSMPASWTGHFGSLVGQASCCWRPFGLMRAGDQPELVALGAPHCATRLLEGETDYNAAYHEGRQRTYEAARAVYRLFGREECLELLIEPEAAHRPYFLIPEALEWVCRHFAPLRWTPEEALRLPIVRIGEWATRQGVELERLYASKASEGGARAVDADAVYRSPATLRCLPDGAWVQAPYSLASWFETVEHDLPPVEPIPHDRAAWEIRRATLRQAIAACLNVPEPGPLPPQTERQFELPAVVGGPASVVALTFGPIALGAYLLIPPAPAPEREAVLFLDASRSREAALESPEVAAYLQAGTIVLALDAVALNDSAYLLGESATAHNVAQIRAAVDYLQSRPELQVPRIACHSAVDEAGLLAAILDDRIAALTLAARSGEPCIRPSYRREGIVPGLARLADRATLLALIPPRPLRLLLPGEPTELADEVYRLYGVCRTSRDPP